MFSYSASPLQLDSSPANTDKRFIFCSWQPLLTTGNFIKGQIDFTKKTKKVFCAAKNIAPRRQLWLHPPVPIQPPACAPTTNRRRLNILYSGRVQGVGFRYTVKTVAAGFAVTGFIRNLPDGRVELTAEGTREELAAFRESILGAGLAGFIRDEQLNWTDAQNEFTGFEISR
jgi:acylphosphatase